LLRLQTDRHLAGQKASETALARLNVELEDRVRMRTTELALARDQAEQSSQAKSKFLATMSHELRTPLNAVIGFSELIRSGIGDGPVIRGYAADIHTAGEQLLKIINDILELSRIEGGQPRLYEEPIEIGVAIEACLALPRQRAGAAGIALSIAPLAHLPQLRADRSRFEQILLNLLSNAVKFTPAGGHVTVEAVINPGGDLVITITDDGIGMKAGELAVAMQPFQQIDSRLARRFEGTGLGCR